MRLSRILRDFSLQALGGYVSTGLQMVRGVALAAILGPSDLGTVVTVGIVFAYSQYADLGISAAVGREIPLSLGAGRVAEARQWQWYAVTCKLLAESALAVGLVAIAVARWHELAPGLRFGLMTAAPVVVFQGTITVHQTVLQARQAFGRATVLVSTLAVALLAASVLGAMIAGISGVFVGQVAAMGVAAAVGFGLAGRARRHHIRWGKIAHLLKVGVPLAALLFAGYNLVYVDQVMVVSLLGRRALGIYSLVLYAGSALYLLPAALAGAVSPRLLRQYGENETVGAISHLTWRPVRALSLAMPPVIMATWLVAPAVIHRFLPDFSDAIGPLRVYVTGVFFLGLNLGVSSTLLALNKHRYNVPVLVGSIGLNVVIDVVLVSGFHLGLYGIAAGSAITYFCYWMVHTTLVRWFFGQHPRAAVVSNLRSGWPGLALACLVVIIAQRGLLASSSLPLDSALLVATILVTLVRWRTFGFEKSRGS